MNVEKLPRDVWAHHVEAKACICHICGFEKSRNYDKLESCGCGAVTAVDNSLGVKRPASALRAGGHPAKRPCFMDNGTKKPEAKFESQLSNSDKVKGMPQAPDVECMEENSGKPSEGAVLTRRFDDTPAVVPIKKRRIQIMKSPSPPPRSPSPHTPLSRSSSPQPVTPARSPASGQTPPSAASISPLLGYSSVSSPRSATLLSISSSKPQGLLQPALHLQPLACAGGELRVARTSSSDNAQASESKIPLMSATTSEVDMSSRGESERKPRTIAEESCNYEYDLTAQKVSGGDLEEADGQNLQSSILDPNHSTEKQDGGLLRTESSSFSRDDRLHWDLNTDMAAWDASTDQVPDKVINDEQAVETSLRSPSANSAEASQDHGNMGCNNDARNEVEEDLVSGEEEEPEKEELETQRAIQEDCDIMEEAMEEEPDRGEQTVDDPEMGEEILEEEPEIMEHNTPTDSEHRKVDSLMKKEAIPPSAEVESAWDAQDEADLPRSGKLHLSDADLSSDGRNAAEPLENQYREDEISVKHLPKSGKQARSLSDDAEGWNYGSEEPEFEEHVDYGDSDFRDVDDVGLDVEDRISLMQEESNWKGEEGPCHSGSFRRTSLEGDTSNAERAAVSCDEQPLEQSPERHTQVGRSRTTGWDQLPEGFDNAEEALKAAKEVSARRGGRGGPWNGSTGRGSSLSSHTATRFGPGPARSAIREKFSSARGDGYYGDRHPDDMLYDRDGYRHGRRPDDNFGVHNAVRGRDPGRRPGPYGRGRAGGWIDSQPGHINQWGHSRHRPNSGFGGPSNAGTVAAARVESSGFIVAPDGALSKPGSGMGPGRGGIRSTVSGGRGGRGGHVQLGRGPPGDMDGVHYPLRAGVGADRVASMNAGGRGLGANSGPGYGSSMHDRGGRGLMDRYRGGGMDSRRSESPRRPHPLDHPNMMSRMPGMRPDSRVMRSRTPPASSHRSGGHTDFSAARSQRSPPPPSRWANDKREVDYQDRDFKRPLSRPRVPSQRTSPHVVHGSSLTDDRDRQVLAGSRQSPPIKGPVNPSLRKSRDESLDSRPLKRNEDEDVRHTGSFSKDGDYRRSSPMRESDRDRERGSLYRRDRDRDRDDDRRRDVRRSPSRDGRFSSGPKYANARDADDDVAPRRRRPS